MLKDNGEGLRVRKPKCIDCKYSNNGVCEFYKKSKLEIKEIFNCKEYIKLKD